MKHLVHQSCAKKRDGVSGPSEERRYLIPRLVLPRCQHVELIIHEDVRLFLVVTVLFFCLFLSFVKYPRLAVPAKWSLTELDFSQKSRGGHTAYLPYSYSYDIDKTRQNVFEIALEENTNNWRQQKTQRNMFFGLFFLFLLLLLLLLFYNDRWMQDETDADKYSGRAPHFIHWNPVLLGGGWSDWKAF